MKFHSEFPQLNKKGIPRISSFFQCGKLSGDFHDVNYYSYARKHMSGELMITYGSYSKYLIQIIQDIMFCRIRSTELSENLGCRKGINIYLKSCYMPSNLHVIIKNP